MHKCTSGHFLQRGIDLVILFQVASKYGMPPEMIKNVYKKTKKG